MHIPRVSGSMGNPCGSPARIIGQGPPAPFAKLSPMDYRLAMRPKRLFILSGAVLLFIVATRLRADLVEMQNGDRYAGKVLSVSLLALAAGGDD